MPAVYVYRRYVRDAIEERVGKKKKKRKGTVYEEQGSNFI